MNEYRKIQIVSDGSCDFTDEHIAKYHVKVVPFYVSFDNKTYKKEREELGVEEFYQTIVENPTVFPKTSLPTVEDYTKVFLECAKLNEDVICICITTKFSGSLNSANVAKEIVKTDYPDMRITVIDATFNTWLQGLLVIEVCKMVENHMTYDEIVNNIERIKPTARIFFSVGNLDYLRHGGRIGKLMGLVGATLKIKPLIVLKDGEIFSCGLTFSRKKSLLKIIQLIEKHFEETHESKDDYEFIVGYGYDYPEVVDFTKRLEESLNIYHIPIERIGATIAAHTGPYPLGVGFIKKFNH